MGTWAMGKGTVIPQPLGLSIAKGTFIVPRVPLWPTPQALGRSHKSGPELLGKCHSPQHTGFSTSAKNSSDNFVKNRPLKGDERGLVPRLPFLVTPFPFEAGKGMFTGQVASKWACAQFDKCFFLDCLKPNFFQVCKIFYTYYESNLIWRVRHHLVKRATKENQSSL